MKDKKGSVLLHVLITSVVVSAIAAGLVRMLMLRYVVTAKQVQINVKKQDSHGILNRLIAHWNDQANGFCSSPPGTPTITCTGFGTACGACTCSVGGVASIVTTAAGTPCQISIKSTQKDVGDP